jgi:hypothetical protein
LFTAISTARNIIARGEEEPRAEGGAGSGERRAADESGRYIDPRNPLSGIFFSGNKAFPNFDAKVAATAG